MQTLSNKPKLNQTQLYLAARALDCSMKEFYAIPENVQKYEEWKLKKGGEYKMRSEHIETVVSPNGRHKAFIEKSGNRYWRTVYWKDNLYGELHKGYVMPPSTSLKVIKKRLMANDNFKPITQSEPQANNTYRSNSHIALTGDEWWQK